MDWDYKINNNDLFHSEIERLMSKFSLNSRDYPKGKKMIIDTLYEIFQIVNGEKMLQFNKESYGNLLPYLEFDGGKEFLETKDGKDTVEIFFYFAYKWKSIEE